MNDYQMQINGGTFWLFVILFVVLYWGTRIRITINRKAPVFEAPLVTEVRNPYFNLKPCSCPSGDCPEWERKAGLETPDPECPIHGEALAA